MSVEEEIELRDLVAQTLDLNGCLSKIRAQLRANLFLALDEDNKINKQQPLFNSKIQSYLSTSEGLLMFGLVREFLEFFDLDFTISVFEPESYLGSQYTYEGREKILDDLGLPNGKKITGPILLELIKIAQTKSRTIQINLSSLKVNKSNDLTSETVEEQTPVENSTPELNSHKNSIKLNGTTHQETENDDTFNGTSSIEEDISIRNETKSTSDSNESKSKEEKSKLVRNDKTKPKESPNKPRVSDILPSPFHNKGFIDKTSREFDDFDIKDDYEEDFMSGSEVEFSLSKVDCPKQLLEELEQSDQISSELNSIRNDSNKLKLSKVDQNLNGGFQEEHVAGDNSTLNNNNTYEL